MSPRLLPVDLQTQLVPGLFAQAMHHLVDQLDLSAFDGHYRNDDNGAPAHAPVMLLMAVLLACSQGMVSSRSIERACRATSESQGQRDASVLRTWDVRADTACNVARQSTHRPGGMPSRQHHRRCDPCILRGQIPTSTRRPRRSFP